MRDTDETPTGAEIEELAQAMDEAAALFSDKGWDEPLTEAASTLRTLSRQLEEARRRTGNWKDAAKFHRASAEAHRVAGEDAWRSLKWIAEWCESYNAEPRTSLPWAQEVITRMGENARRIIGHTEEAKP